MNPLVSIIIPGFNHERYVREAVESVLQQTYDNIELIFIDDASSDSTFEIADAIIKKNKSRFKRFLSEKSELNRGAESTINLGIAKSKGDYITILNSDDFFAFNRIEEILAAMIQANGLLGFSAVVPIDITSSEIPTAQLPPSLSDVFNHAEFATDLYPSMGFALLDRNITISTGNLLFSRQLYETIGGFHKYQYIHDWDFVLRASLQTELVYLNQPLYFYRIHPTNSFKRLADVAEAELDQMVQQFLLSITNVTVRNPKAALPELWPGLYDYLAEKTYLMQRAISLRLHQPHTEQGGSLEETETFRSFDQAIMRVAGMVDEVAPVTRTGRR